MNKGTITRRKKETTGHVQTNYTYYNRTGDQDTVERT